MKKFLLLNLIFLLLGISSAFASDCSYCGKLDRLKARFARVTPDPMNEKTIDLQDELLGQTEGMIKEIAKRGPSDKDVERIVSLLAVAVPFDYSESLGEGLYHTYKPFSDRLYAEVRRQEKERRLSADQAKEIIINIATGENTIENGTDSAH
jgi:hypothetical protein